MTAPRQVTTRRPRQYPAWCQVRIPRELHRAILGLPPGTTSRVVREALEAACRAAGISTAPAADKRQRRLPGVR